MNNTKKLSPIWNEFEWEIFRNAVEDNGGYCPCMVERTPDTKCMCKDFREQESGLCHCGRFEKVEV